MCDVILIDVLKIYKLQDTVRGIQVQCQLFYVLNSNREVHKLVQTTLTRDSPFHLCHAEAFTDATVYPPPTEFSTIGSAQKKRKRDDDALADDVTLRSDIQHAKIPSLMVSNRHMSQKVHYVVKKECAELAEMIVCLIYHLQ